MKKILLTTSALAFAGSAFAADVSGYVVSAYKKSGADKSVYSEAEIYVSGSKTTSNGITFGATYTIGHSGDASANGAVTTTSTTKEVKVSGKGDTKTSFDADVTSVVSEATTTQSNKMYANVNAFVSGSFGKVQMGKHASAAKSVGAKSTFVGNGTEASTAVGSHSNTVKGITYTSPTFNGIQAAYTHEISNNGLQSLGINYTGSASGVDFKLAYGDEKTGTGEKSSTWGDKASKDPFAVSYAKAKDKAVRIGVSYTAGQVSVGYSQATKKTLGDKETALKATGIALTYTVSSGLQVFADTMKGHDNVRTTYIGTNISF